MRLCRVGLALAVIAASHLLVLSLSSHVRLHAVLFTLLIGFPSAGIILLIHREHFRQVIPVSSAMALGVLAGFMLYPRVSYGSRAGDAMILGAAISGIGYLMVRLIMKMLQAR